MAPGLAAEDPRCRVLRLLGWLLATSVVVDTADTVIGVLPLDAAKVESPPKLAVMVAFPTANPLAALTATLFNVAVPPESVAVPSVVVLDPSVTVKVTVPAIEPYA